MKTSFLACIAFIFFNTAFCQKKSIVSLSPYFGLSQENLDWNISGDQNGSNPNILSELKWKGVRGPKLGMTADFNPIGDLYFRTDFAFTIFTVGNVSDIDYAGDNRTFKTAEFQVYGDKGYSAQILLDVLYKLNVNQHIALLPHVGYSGQFQSFYMVDGPIPVLAGQELNSGYQPQWQGISYGLSVKLTNNSWSADLDLYRFYLPRYHARANWNLQQDFKHPVSFVHRSKGYGWKTNFTTHYKLSDNISPFLKFEFQTHSAGYGRDILFLNNGDVVQSRLNGVRNSKLAAAFGVTYTF